MICRFIQVIAEYQSRKAELYLKHLTWQTMTDNDSKCVTNLGKPIEKD